MASRGRTIEIDMAKNPHFASASLRSLRATCAVRPKRVPGGTLTPLPPAHAANRQIRGQVHHEGDEKQQRAGQEEHPVMARSGGRLAELGGDVRGEGADRVQQAVRYL